MVRVRAAYVSPKGSVSGHTITASPSSPFSPPVPSSPPPSPVHPRCGEGKPYQILFGYIAKNDNDGDDEVTLGYT